MGRDLPDGTVTFLFTDIEGSTQLLERLPAAYGESLKRHDAHLRRAVAAHNGVVFETIGDAIYAAFDRPTEAIAAALEAQLELRHEQWGEIGELRVRMGLHTGEAERRGDHYFGRALYRCARLTAIGYGAQVLVSSVTASLVRDGLPPGASLRSLGSHRLKDLGDPEEPYQLEHAELIAEFPALKSLDARPNNLPVELSTFVGREHELAEVRRLLDAKRLVTITGPGGTGKTRLSLQVAADAIDGFADGTFFVSLASVAEARLVLTEIARAIGVREVPGEPLAERVKQHLATREVLMVLDNFEQVVSAAETVADLLGSAARLKILVTSRAPLRVAGEQEYPVPPLEVPDLHEPPPLEHLVEYDAVRLFIDRATDVRPDFALTTENARPVAEICRRLDGLPLAIELAAARVRVLTPRDLLARLDHGLPVLVGGPRDAPARQRTMRETISWSHDLLDNEDQVVFRRFSVFNGGCTLEDAEAVLAFGDIHESAVIDRLESLAAKSLIRADGSRFSMLALIREYAGVMLDSSGEAEATHRRHAEHYESTASRLDSALRSNDQLNALVRFDRESDNVRAALEWSVSSAERRLALLICTSMCWYWFMRSRNSEAQHWLGLVVGDLAGAADREAAAALAWAGFLAYEQGRIADASSLGEAGLTAARRTTDPATILRAILLFTPTQVETDFKTVHATVDEAIEVATGSGDPFLLAWVHSFAGELCRTEGREDDALVHYTLSIEFGRASGDRLFLSTSLMNSAHIHLKRANVALAYELLAESLDTFGSLGMHWGVAYTLIGLAGVAVATGQSDTAVILLGAVDGWFRGTGIQIQPADREDFDRYLATARSSLDQVTFAHAWEKGQTLSLDDAVLFATARAKTGPTA